MSFCHQTTLIPIIIIGYIWVDRKIFFHAICILLSSMLFNSSLKNTFKIPLSPALGKQGFAFPSGHMQTAFVFYGWLFRSIKVFSISIIIIILLFGVCFGLMHFGYHNFIDILGSLFFGSFLMIVYNEILKRLGYRWILIFILGFSTSLVIYNIIINSMKDYSWMAYYALIGIVFAEVYLEKKFIDLSVFFKIVSTIICITLFAVIINIWSFFGYMPVFISELKWIFIGISIPCSRYLGSIMQIKYVEFYN